MACQIRYNSQGGISEVLNLEGKPSKLYKQIAKHPLVKSKEDALALFKNVYGEKVNDDEAILLHKIGEDVYYSYGEALEYAKEGDVIEVTLNDTPVMSVKYTINPATVEGFVNLQIKNKILSEERVFDPEGTFYKAKGETTSAKAMNTALLEEQLKHHVGLGGFKRHKGYKYSILGIKPKEAYGESTVDSKIAKELADSSMMRTFGSNKETQSLPYNESELQVKLLNLLNDLGIKVTSISDYVAKYNEKHGVDPSAKALADISAKVIAFQNGEINTQDLTEEVAHFIVEGFPQDEVENVLRNIHKTDEWAEHAADYRDVYSKEYSGEALENAVRREVLGKVLANSLLNNFSTEGKQGTSSSIITKIKELFINFFRSISGYTTVQERTEIQDFVKRVQDSLADGTIGTQINQNNFQGNKFRFYSTQQASTKGDDNSINMIRSRSLAAIEVLKRQINDLAKTKKGSGVSREQLKQATIALTNKLESLEEEEVMQSITTFLEVTRKQINYIETALKNNAKDEYSLSQEEVAVYQSLSNDLNPILSELRERVKGKKGAHWSTIEKRITASLDSIDSIQGQKEVQEDEVIEKLVDKVVERHNLDKDKYADYIREWYKTAQKDTSYFHATFGQMIHAHDPLLSLAGTVIQDTMNEARIKYLKATKELQQELKKNGLTEKDLDQFFDKGYLVDVVDHKAFEDSLLDMRLKVLQEYSPEAKKLSLEELKRRYKSPSRDPKNTLPKVDPSKEVEMSAEIKKRQNGMVERVMKKEYYDKQQERYDKAGVSQVTINFLRAISQTRGGILAGARKKDGTVDRTLLSESDNSRIDELARDRKTAKSPYNSSGKLKKGLVPNKDAGQYDPLFILEEGAEHSQEAIIAADIHAIDALYMKESAAEGKDPQGITNTFLDALEEAEAQGHQHALDFLRLNSNLAFTEDFWEGFGQNQSVVERLEDVMKASQDESHKRAIEGLLKDIHEMTNRRKNILKIFQNPNNPAEMDVDHMDKEMKQEVRYLTEEINRLYNRAFQYLPQEEDGSDKGGLEFEQSTNEAYQKALDDNNIDTVGKEIDFIKDHVTRDDLNKIAQLEGYLTDYNRGFGGSAPGSLRRYIDENIDMQGFNVQTEVRNYAKTRLLPYYRRLAPQGYSNVMYELNNGTKSATEFVKEVQNGLHFIKVIPNYSFIQQESDMVNPNYRADYEGGFLQPKHGEFKNQNFENLFAPKKNTNGSYVTKKNDKGYIEYIPTKNQALYNGYEALKQYQRENLDQIGELGSHNLYKLPQISKSTLEKITAFANKASVDKLGEAWKDFSMYRVDEMERGAEFDGYTLSNSKVIPKYYTRDLENEDDVSTQLFTSYAAFSQQAYLHRARRNNIGDMFALRERILTRDTGHLNKAPEATSTYKMFQSYMDANFFGITEQSKLAINILGREVDLTKLARRFLNFIKFKNLGLSTIVPATSWLTAEVNSKIENWVKEHTNVRSAELAFKEFKKLAPDSAKEFMKLNSEAKLTVLGEFMGIFDPGNRFKDSSYGKTVRFGWKMGMGLHQAANFPIIPRIMLSVLYDYRVVEGNIVNYNTFLRQQRAADPALSNKDIDAQWAKYEEKAVYNFLDINETTVEWKKDVLEKELDRKGEDLDKFLGNKLNGIQSRIEEATSNIDGSISDHRQISASRHYLLNYFMTHRNWLTIATSRRFKLDQYNLQTGEKEEGSWVSMYKFMGDYFKAISGSNSKDFRKTMREQWANADEMQKKNLRRAGIDLAVLNALALLGFLIANAADDEDNEDLWALQLGNYLFHRTMNETASSSLALPNQYMEVLESPFVGLNTVQEIGKLYKVFDGEEIAYGKYRGMTVGQRQLIKTVPGIKQMRELSNPKQASDTYRFYNSHNLNTVPLNWFLNE